MRCVSRKVGLRANGRPKKGYKWVRKACLAKAGTISKRRGRKAKTCRYGRKKNGACKRKPGRRKGR